MSEEKEFPSKYQKNNPKYVLRVKGQINSCLGSQLLDILNVISPCKWIWYGADVDAVNGSPLIDKIKGWSPQKIGTTEDLKKIAKGTDQFLSGIFLALSNHIGEITHMEFSTEDEPFRCIDPAILEIRAFDTSYFELYSSDFNFLEKIQAKTGGEICKCP